MSIGLRSESKERTRDALIDAGLHAFRESGIEGPSLDNICAAAGFTRGAFYVHFVDREAFQVAVMERVLNGYLNTIVVSAEPADDVKRSVFRFVDEVLAGLKAPEDTAAHGLASHNHLRLLLDATRRVPAVRERFVVLVRLGGVTLTNVVERGQAAGTVRADVAADVIAGLLVSLVLGVIALVETGVPSRDEVERMRDGVLVLLQ